MSIAGFGYSFFNNELRDFSHPAGFDEFSGDIKDLLQPLVFQPGEGWQYGLNIDYAGLALERATGVSLNNYCHKNIFEPLGLKSICECPCISNRSTLADFKSSAAMFPTADMKKKLAFMHQRKHDGTLIARDHLLRKPLVVEDSEVKNVVNSGGAGAFSKPSDYARKLSQRKHGVDTLIQYRDHCNAAQRWHFANDRRTDPQGGDCRSHVHEPD